MSTPAFLVDPYIGIGDSMYLRISIKKLLETHNEVFLCSPFPRMFQDLEGIRLLDPSLPGNRKLMRYDPVHYDIFKIPHFTEMIFDRWTPDFHDRLFLSKDIKPEHRYQCMYDGSGLKGDRFYAEMMVDGVFQSIRESNVPPMGLREPDDRQVEITRNWFYERGIDPSKAILFHSTWRTLGHTESDVHVRSMNDAQWLDLRRTLEEMGYQLFDTERLTTGLISFLPDVPVMHTSGWDGLMTTLSAVKMCSGVVLQGPCRLLPVAQNYQKPTIVCSQGYSKLCHFNWEEAFGKLFIELEPDEPHACLQSFCKECRSRTFTPDAITKAATSFHHDIQTTTRSS